MANSAFTNGGGGAVDSVNGQTGVVLLDTGDIAEATNLNYVSDAQLTVIGNTSGTNTGDQTSIIGITGTKAQFDTACSDGNFLYVGDVSQYTDEMAQDAVGAMINTSLTYVDGTPSLGLTSRTINGTAFDGTANITVTTAAGTLTGATLAAGVTASSLTSVGTLTGLDVVGTSATLVRMGQSTANPALRINSNTASSINGWEIISSASGNETTLRTISSATDAPGSIGTKGTAYLDITSGNFVTLKVNGGNSVACSNTGTTFAYAFRGFSSNTCWSFTGNADSNLTASTEAKDMYLNFAQEKSYAAGALATHRSLHISPSIVAFAGASTLTNWRGVTIDSVAVNGTNATVTNATTLTIPAPTGATNNYVMDIGAGVTKQATTTVGALIAAGTAGAGARSIVSDASAPTFGATVTGGGAVVVPVYSDGTNWKVG